MLKYVASKRGQPRLVLENHMFYVETKTDNVTRWKCSSYQKCKCPSRVTTEDGRIIIPVTKHNHVADAAAIEAEEVIEKINNQASQSRDTPSFVIGSNVGNCSQSAKGKIRRASALSRNIQNRRRKQLNEPPPPLKRADIDLPSSYCVTDSGKNFLLYDSGRVADRILVFGTSDNVDLLETHRTWFADGTFKHTPLLFYQIYTIHIFARGHAIPVIYALLPNKKKVTYKLLFQALMNLKPTLNPKMMITDFEEAATRAFAFVFPASDQHGCFFHFGQAIWRKIQQEGLQKRYEKDADFAFHLRHIAALAFVPVAEVEDAYEELLREGVIPPEANAILDYFEDTWLGRRTRDGRRRPRYPIELWNCYQSVLDESPRTNNSVEAWHRALDALTYGHHENIWRTISTFKKSHAKVELAVEQEIAGDPPPPKKKKYRDADARIRRIVESFNTCTLLEYLRGIAHNLQY